MWAIHDANDNYVQDDEIYLHLAIDELAWNVPNLPIRWHAMGGKSPAWVISTWNSHLLHAQYGTTVQEKARWMKNALVITGQADQLGDQANKMIASLSDQPLPARRQVETRRLGNPNAKQ